MTRQEWERQKITLKGSITRAKNALTKNVTLAEKIQLKLAVKAAENALHQHILNQFEMISPEEDRSSMSMAL